LKRRLAEVDRIDVSRYQFINMERLRDAAGANWPAMRARVFLATRSMIERRVAEDDLIIPCATGYLVIFKALAQKLAERTTERIREDMERFFLGDGELAQLNVEAVAEQLSIAEFEAALAAADLDFAEAPGLAPPPHAAQDEAAFDGLDYVPAWDARQEAAASYFATPRPAVSSDGVRPSAVLKPEKPDPRLAFDLEVLDTAITALEALVSNGTRCALIIPAGYASLSLPRTRSAYVTALSQAPEALKSLIWVRLEDAPTGPPRAVMAETGRILKAQAAQLFVDASLDTLDLSPHAETGAAWVGAGLSPNRSLSTARLERFTAIAQRRNMATYVSNADKPDQLHTALQAKARLIAGRSIAVYDAPRAPFRLSRAALLSRAA
jgi:hypothetical protein